MVIPEQKKAEITKKLKILYGNQAKSLFTDIEQLFENHLKNISILYSDSGERVASKVKCSKNDIILNTYADSIQDESYSPLETLSNFSRKYIQPIINGCHILPFYKWDTDRGFSVLDYYSVDPRNGSWEQFSELKNSFDVLMVDCVLNHASLDNPIVQGSLKDEGQYRNFVITYSDEDKPSEEDQLKITRARPYPVLTRYYVVEVEKKRLAIFNKPLDGNILKKGWVWTTFSRANNPDGTVATRQVDLNFKNPKVFLEIVKLLLFYISKGATWIRLDAIGYLWKNVGTSCLHLPETHLFIEVISELFNGLESMDIVLISEVNEPQERALQYLGSVKGQKSDMIYLFTHFPLAVHAVLTGTAKYYNKWLPSLKIASGRLFVSVLGTHDGMGMKPIGNWLPEVEKHKLQQILLHDHDALANYARLPGGDTIVYELCATPWNFINKDQSEPDFLTNLNRYLAVLALGLMIKGVPSIYINGLLGITNNKEKLDENRTINRQVLYAKELNIELNNKNSQMSLLMSEVLKLIAIRKGEEAFDLDGTFEVLDLNPTVVSVLLSDKTSTKKLIAMVNVSNFKQEIFVDCSQLGFNQELLFDVITKNPLKIPAQGTKLSIKLAPYQISWLR